MNFLHLSSRTERNEVAGLVQVGILPASAAPFGTRLKWELDPIDLLALSTLRSRRLSLRPVITIPIQGRVAA